MATNKKSTTEKDIKKSEVKEKKEQIGIPATKALGLITIISIVIGLLLGLMVGFVIFSNKGATTVGTVTDSDIISTSLEQSEKYISLSEQVNGFDIKESMASVFSKSPNAVVLIPIEGDADNAARQFIITMNSRQQLETIGYTSTQDNYDLWIVWTPGDFENAMKAALVSTGGEENETERKLKLCLKRFNEDPEVGLIKALVLDRMGLSEKRGKQLLLSDSISCDNVTYLYSLKIEDGLLTTSVGSVSVASTFQEGIVGGSVFVPSEDIKDGAYLAVAKNDGLLEYSYTTSPEEQVAI